MSHNHDVVVERQQKTPFFSKLKIFSLGPRINRIQLLGLFSLWFSLALVLVFLVAYDYIHLYFGLFFVPLFFFTSINLHVKRLHDINYSGWWYLLGIIPCVGLLICLILFLFPGTKDNNKFGDQPVVVSKRYYLMCLMLPMLYLICLLIGKIGEIFFM